MNATGWVWRTGIFTNLFGGIRGNDHARNDSKGLDDRESGGNGSKRALRPLNDNYRTYSMK